MLCISQWQRLLDYLDRMGAPYLIRQPSKEYVPIPCSFAENPLPIEYMQFVEHYGYPTLYIDEDLCLGFLPPKQIYAHPLLLTGVYPFAVCSSDCQVTVVLDHNDIEWNVVVYEGMERVDSEGSFVNWMEGQVRQFLLQLMNYDFQDLQTRQFSLRNDPLLLCSSNRFANLG